MSSEALDSQVQRMQLAIRGFLSFGPDEASSGDLHRQFLEQAHGLSDPASGAVLTSLTEDSCKSIRKLKGEDAKAIIAWLDPVMRRGVVDNKAQQRGIRIMRKLCRRNNMYPPSIHLPPGKIRLKSEQAENLGGQADVYMGTLDGQQVAVKHIRHHENQRLPESQVTAYCKEAVYWRYLRHRNITPFYGVDTTVRNFTLVSKWMEGKDLRTHLKGNPGANRIRLLLDAARGLRYLHNLGVIHADLKAQNIVVDEDGVACLCDFGISTLTQNIELYTTPTGSPGAGTLRWKAPELMEESLDPQGTTHPRHTLGSDIYAFGMTMWEMFTGLLPYHTVHTQIVAVRILEGYLPSRPPYSWTTEIGLSDEIWALMDDTWAKAPAKRPNIDEVLETLEAQLARRQEYGIPPQWPMALVVGQGWGGYRKRDVQ
ncbi:hypothetical protein CERSUDRAFT_95042 [Gelatoporia subvermispora B]|uniref:Protein kinase domain-containing protein n=1 Tax=Ceriporiopsis subvermispora (strain B) TaxID=914234 RepID=M2RE90_CERS8|nr:hypothetical protein CERSUDRAFT_95042 [Gelatoporia subvermispora B]